MQIQKRGWRVVMRPISLLCLLMAMFVLSSPASAQSVLEIVSADTSAAPEVSFVLSARTDGTAITGLKSESVRLLVDKDEVKLKDPRLQSFKQGEKPIAVVVVFPIGKDYVEEFFGIRTALGELVSEFRPIDHLGAVYYGKVTTNLGPFVGEGAPRKLADAIKALENTQAIDGNVYAAMSAAITMVKGIEGVEHRYVVLVSNAEGSPSGDDAEATGYIRRLQSALKEANVRPLIVGYTPDGPRELYYRKWLSQIAAGRGTYLEATEMAALPPALSRASDLIFQQYIFRAELEQKLEEGKYKFTVRAKVGDQELEDTVRAIWPKVAAVEEKSSTDGPSPATDDKNGGCNCGMVKQPVDTVPLTLLLLAVFGFWTLRRRCRH